MERDMDRDRDRGRDMDMDMNRNWVCRSIGRYSQNVVAIHPPAENLRLVGGWKVESEGLRDSSIAPGEGRWVGQV